MLFRSADCRFAQILDVAIASRGKLRAVLDRHGDEIRYFAHLRAALGIGPDDDESGIVTRFCSGLRAERAELERIAAWLESGAKTDQGQAARLRFFLVAASDADAYKSIREIFLTAAGEPRKQTATKKHSEANPGMAMALDSLCKRFLDAEEKRKAAVVATMTEALVTVALAVLDVYDRLKRERAALDYDDLIRCTLALLDRGDAALWVLFKLDNGISHILVDEAQDTSPEQWKIVAKLAGEFFAGSGAREDASPRTLFAVGDEKQSIFSFQGADPAAFGRHRAKFKEQAEGAGLPF